MPEVEHTPLAPGHESRTEYGVGATVDQWPQKFQVFIRVVLKVCVLNDGEFSASLGDRPAEGCSFALVAGGPQQADHTGVFFRYRFHFFDRRVGGTVVGDDNLAVET